MKRFIKLLACGFAAAVSLCPPAYSDEYGTLAKKLARAAAAAGVRKVAVAGFSPKGAASQEEADFIAEQISSRLYATKKVEVVERALLDKVLGERKLMEGLRPDGAWLDDLSGFAAAEAVVTGTVFAAMGSVRIIVKMVDPCSGKLLAAVEAEAGREAESRAAREELPLPAFYAAPVPADALAGAPSAGCAARSRELKEQNGRNVRLKAKYWALKMREPGFSYSRVTRNPGSELRDGATKNEFYRLLAMFYSAETPAVMDEEELRSLRALMAKEEEVYGDCGSL